MNNRLFKTFLEEMTYTARLLSRYGWAEAHAGNMSADITYTLANPASAGFTPSPLKLMDIEADLIKSKLILITTSGSRMDLLAKNPLDFLCILDFRNPISDPILWRKNSQATISSEWRSHIRLLHALDKKADFLLHAHCTELIRLSHKFKGKSEEMSRSLYDTHPELELLCPEGISLLPYEEPGTDALAHSSLKAIVENDLLIWEKHGGIARAKKPLQALGILEAANKVAGIYLSTQNS